jgi:hypothetical protein
MRLAEQQFPLLDAEKFDGEVSWRHLLEFYVMRRSRLRRIRGTGFMERRRVQSVRLDVGCADHLAPLLGFVGDEPAKISG